MALVPLEAAAAAAAVVLLLFLERRIVERGERRKEEEGKILFKKGFLPKRKAVKALLLSSFPPVH